MGQFLQRFTGVSWLRVLAEFVAITGAVYLGLLADNYREYRVERTIEVEYLRQFVEDLALDSEALRYTQVGIERHANASQVVHDFFGGRRSDLVELEATIPRFFSIWTYEQQRQSFMSLRDGPGVHIISDRDLRVALFEYYEIYQNRFQQDYMSNYDRAQQEFLARLFQRILYLPADEVDRLSTGKKHQNRVRLLEPISNFRDDTQLASYLAKMGVRAYEIVYVINTLLDRNAQLRSRLELAISELED